MKDVLFATAPGCLERSKDLPDYTFWCPGCKSYHGVWVSRPNYLGAQWRFNGDMQRPTFTPSLHIGAGTASVCHSFVRDGRIEYLPDCTHELSGKTVTLDPYE